MNKRGSIFDIITWVIVTIVTILILGAGIYMVSQLTNALDDVGALDNGVNVSEITDQTFEIANTALVNWVPTIAFLILMLGGISILLSNFLIKAHPAFFFLYIVMTIAAIIVSAYVSNVYMDTLLAEDTIGSTLSQFTEANFVMQYLPYFATVIGIFGAIFLFIGIIRNREQEVAFG